MGDTLLKPNASLTVRARTQSEQIDDSKDWSASVRLALTRWNRNRLVHAKQRQHDPGDIREGGSQIQQRNRLSFACFNLFNGRFRCISNCFILII